MRFKYLNGVLITMFLLTLLWAGKSGVSAQNNVEAPSVTQNQATPPVQQGAETQPAQQQNVPPSSVERSEFKGWFNRTGSGLFVSLTPFATAVTLGVLLLIILVPILIGAKSKRSSRGYFKTIPHAR